MRIIVAHKDPQEALRISAIFAAHGCTVDIVEDPSDPEFYEFAFQRTNHTAFAVIASDCMASFNAAAPQEDGNKPLAFPIKNAQGLDENTLTSIFALTAEHHGHEDDYTLDVAGLGIDMTGYENAILNCKYKNIPIKKDGQTINLTETEYQILRFLALNRNKVISKDDFLTLLYNDGEEKTEKNIPVQIVKLRKKIEAGPSNSQIIRTVWGKGYQLVDETTLHQRSFDQYGPLKFYDDYSVTWDDTPINLNNQKRNILKYIVTHPDRAINNESVINDKKHAGTILRTRIGEIRQAIAKASISEENPEGINIIKNAYGKGYQYQEPLPTKPKTQKPTAEQNNAHPEQIPALG